MAEVKPIIAEDGNRYWKDAVSRIFLRFKEPPKRGRQVRCLGSTRKGVWLLTRDINDWMYIDKCWYANVFILQNCKTFNFNLCRMTGVLPDGAMKQGFFCPEYVLLKYAHRIHYRSYELQVEVRPEDLYETYEEAKSAFTQLRAVYAPPPPQGKLFDEASS